MISRKNGHEKIILENLKSIIERELSKNNPPIRINIDPKITLLSVRFIFSVIA
jgi:hypothetical protein